MADSISLSDFLDDLEKADKKTDILGKAILANIGGAFQGITRLASSMGVELGFGPAILGVAKLGIAAEQTELAFTSMTGSADSAKALLTELSDFAAETSYGKQEVIDAGKQLLSFGFGADGLTEKLAIIGDVATGLNAPLDDMAKVFGTVKMQGHAMTTDLDEFANQGVPIFEEVAKVLGINSDQVEKFASSGKVTYGVIEKAFQNMNGEGGKFFHAMDDQGNTTGGRLSAAFEKLMGLGEKLGIALLPVIGSLADMGAILLDTLKPVVDALTPALQWFGENLNTILMVVTPLTAAIAAYAIVTELQTLWAARATIAQWAMNVAMNANPIGLIVAGITLLVGGLILAYNNSETFRNVLNGLWEVIKLGWGWIKQIALAIWEWSPIFILIRANIKALAAVFQWLWPIIKNVFTNIKTWIVNTFGGVFTWIIDKIKQFIGFLGGIADKLGLTSIINEITDAFNKGASGEVVVKDETPENVDEELAESSMLSTVKPPETVTGIAAGIQTTATLGAGGKLVGISPDERAGKNVNVTIEKLIGEMSFNSSTFKESESELREKVKSILVDAVRDSELSY